MIRRRHRRKQNLFSGVVFGFAVVLATAAAVHVVKQPVPPHSTGGLAIAGASVQSDANGAMAAAAPSAALPPAIGPSALVTARSAAGDRTSAPAAESVDSAIVEPEALEPATAEPEPLTPAMTEPEPLVQAVQTAEIDPAVDAISAGLQPEPLLVPEEPAPDEFLAPSDDGALDGLQPAAGPARGPDLEIGSVLGLLRAQGFGSFSAVSRQGNAFVFHAQKGGQPVQVTVDAATGAVLAVQ